MPKGRHCRKACHDACSCEMGNLYRFAEPVVLVSLACLREACGYLITQQAESLAVTHAGLDTAVVYRTLHRLEKSGKVCSRWDRDKAGPARRLYRLNEEGTCHIGEWADVLEDLIVSLRRLHDECRKRGPGERAGE